MSTVAHTTTAARPGPAPRVLICGGWYYAQYEAACAGALERLGARVDRFVWDRYFRGSPLARAEAKYVVAGPSTRALNRDLAATVARVDPDVLLVWRGTHVLPRTLREIRASSRATIVGYVNDDPFSPAYARSAPLHQRRLWRHFTRALPLYDEVLVYRPANVDEALAHGARRARVLLPYFMPEVHAPVALSAADRAEYECDAVFVGHYEPDGRSDYLQALVDAGLRVRVFGGNTWPLEVQRRLGVRVRPALDADYAKALAGARMALCFLSRLNRDRYTRRCFEIPACGTVLLSERTPELERMFDDRRDAVFFSSIEELVTRARWLRDHPDEAAAIARRGRERVWRDGHDVDSRMTELLDMIARPMTLSPMP